MIVETGKTKFEITNANLPDGTKKQEALKAYSRFIVAGYRNVPQDKIEKLLPSQEIDAVDGLMQATNLSTLHKDGELAAVLAYSVLTPNRHHSFYNHMLYESESNIKSNRRIKNSLSRIEGVFMTDEMVVAAEHRGKGYSHFLREQVLKSLLLKQVVMVGEIISPYSAVQRLRQPGSTTIWAGEYINEHMRKTPDDLSVPEVQSAADRVGR